VVVCKLGIMCSCSQFIGSEKICSWDGNSEREEQECRY
jgi:hypothetical protein